MRTRSQQANQWHEARGGNVWKINFILKKRSNLGNFDWTWVVFHQSQDSDVSVYKAKNQFCSLVSDILICASVSDLIFLLILWCLQISQIVCAFCDEIVYTTQINNAWKVWSGVLRKKQVGKNFMVVLFLELDLMTFRGPLQPKVFCDYNSGFAKLFQEY